MARQALLSVALSLLVALAGCAERSVQTASAEHDSGSCVAVRPAPPFAGARNLTPPPHADVLWRC
jgi:hypothetical protein